MAAALVFETAVCAALTSLASVDACFAVNGLLDAVASAAVAVASFEVAVAFAFAASDFD